MTSGAKAQAFFLLLLGVAVVVVHHRLWQCDFLDLDDVCLVVHNLWVRSGAYARMFTAPFAGLYLPLTMASWAFEYQLFGPDPHIFHATNLALHLLNTLLVWLLVGRITRGDRFVAWTVTLLYAFHPLHVESVAWIAERKDVLCAAFYLLALYLYVKPQKAQTISPLRYLAVWLAMVGALLAKPMAVSLPLVLIIHDLCLRRSTLWGAVRGKFPLLITAAGITIVSITAQSSMRGIQPTALFSLDGMVSAASFFTMCLSKALWPARLSFLYEVGSKALSLWDVARLLLCATLFGLAFWHLPRWRAQAAWGAAFFLVTILPVARLVKFGDDTLFNDRFFYLPGIGIYWLFATALKQAVMAKRYRFYAACVGVGVLAATFAVISLQRVMVFQNAETLWLDVLAKYPDSVKALRYLADYYAREGRYTEGIAVYRRARRLMAGDAMIDAGLADALIRTGQLVESKQVIDDALEHFGEYGEILHARAVHQIFQGDLAGAEISLKHALSAPSVQIPLFAANNRGRVHANLGLVYLREGRLAEARIELESALLDDADDATVYQNLGLVVEGIEGPRPAQTWLEQAIALNPRFVPAYRDLALCYWQQGLRNDAIGTLKKAVSLQPDARVERCYLREMLQQAGQREESERVASPDVCNLR